MHAKSINLLTLLNLGTTVIAAANSLLMVNLFGAGREVEVYFAASTLQLMVFKLTQSGQFSTLFVSRYAELRTQHGQKDAWEMFSCLLNWIGLWAVLVGAAFFFGAGAIMNLMTPGFAAADMETSVAIFRWLIGPLMISILEAFFGMQANAENRYGGPETVRLVEGLTSLLTLVVLAPSQGVWAVIQATWIGRLINLAGNSWLLRRSGYVHAWVLKSPWLSGRQIAANFGYTGLYTVITQVMTGTMTAALTCLPPGWMATYKYVEQLYSRLSVTLFRPITVVLLNSLAADRAAGGQRAAALREEALRRGAFLWAVCLAAVGGSAHLWLSALWGSARFSAGAINEAAHLTIAFVFLLWPFFSSTVANRMLLISQSPRTYYLTLAATQVVTATAAWPLIRHWGVQGALALQLLNVAGFWLGAIAVCSPKEFLPALWRDMLPFLRWLPAAVFALGSAVLLSSLPRIDAAGTPAARLMSAGWGALIAGEGVVMLLICAHFFGREEPANWWNLAWRKMRAFS